MGRNDTYAAAPTIIGYGYVGLDETPCRLLIVLPSDGNDDQTLAATIQSLRDLTHHRGWQTCLLVVNVSPGQHVHFFRLQQENRKQKLARDLVGVPTACTNCRCVRLEPFNVVDLVIAHAAH